MRYHYMDTARVGCMLLGIPYHVSLLYSRGPWYFKAGQQDVFIEIIGRSTSIFRMPLFFIIAGFFSAQSLMRSDAREWLGKRAMILLVPVLFSLPTINQIILFFADYGHGDWGGLESSINRRSSIDIVSHLWFLITLFWISFVFAIGWDRGWFGIEKIKFDVTYLVLVVSAFLIWELGVESVIRPHIVDSGFINLGQTLKYMPYFVLGAWLAQSQWLLEWFLRLHPLAIALAILGPVLSLVNGMPAWMLEVVKALSALLVSKLVLGLVFKFGNVDNRWIKQFSVTSFTIYLVHLPISLILGVVFLQSEFHPIMEFVIICFAVLILSHSFSIGVQRTPVLKFLLNGAVSKRKVGILK